MPGVVIFLDVDGTRPLPPSLLPLAPARRPPPPSLVTALADLQDIGDLESYVRATGVMLFFLSKRYFSSRNCLREVRASLEENFAKPRVRRVEPTTEGSPVCS